MQSVVDSSADSEVKTDHFQQEQEQPSTPNDEDQEQVEVPSIL
ncbi:hypothetical protein DFA_03881 [Cavenderia fasciculata]|uniref:Uncharacterized protein n=1 Tax=Cavenderia fasciculata TaxID=261658 RepID=F4Q0N6_CACFS|nr:uncharacterized protein DFA_03881 [Cavenderia fasciculata]EGG18387.1 hypothetical protein DFA_03881 [Cavenderia fasciculata]|eukprot:XP_004366291.1 hypothetical protein DFA_03881 [Cavenderia fasciculata]